MNQDLYWNRIMKYFIIIIIICSTLFALDILDENGDLDLEKLQTVLNEPIVRTPCRMPFIEQWMEGSKIVIDVKTFPEQERVYSNDHQEIQWVYVDDEWIAHGKNEYSYVALFKEPTLKRAVFQIKDTKYEITGEFKVKISQPIIIKPSCDIVKDGRVDLQDFAAFASGWPYDKE